jgi:RimJ/RimL family protein N-acetyltransferase
VIETERLRLRPWREEDRASFAALLNTPAVMAHLGGVRAQTDPDPSFDKRLADQARDGFSYWAVELRETGTLVGTCGVRRGVNYAGTPVAGLLELGWRFGSAYWGRGYAREAAEATIAWSWTKLDAPLLAAWTTIENRPSWGLMERLGMARRPDLDFHRTDDPTQPLIVYTLERPR